MRTLILALLATAVSVAGPASAQDKKYNLTVAGYSPGGFVSTVGRHGSRAQQGLSGLDRDLPDVERRSRQCDDAGRQQGAAGLSRRYRIGGRDRRQKADPQGLTNLRQLFRPYSPSSRFQMTHMICNKDWADKHGIKTIADIAAKKPPMKIALNRPGNLDGDVARRARRQRHHARRHRKGGRTIGTRRLRRSHPADARPAPRRWRFGISINHPRIREMANGLDIVMLPMTEARPRRLPTKSARSRARSPRRNTSS